MWHQAGPGRPVGSKNVKSQAFRDRLRSYCDGKHFDPHYWMVDLICDPTYENIEHKIQCAKEVASYLESKMKSVDLEVSGNADQPLTIVLRRPGANGVDVLADMQRGQR